MGTELSKFRLAFITVGILSTLLNVLVLGSSVYMMLVYDLALPSGSGPTLVGLLAMVAIVYAFQGLIDVMRSRILMRIGSIFAHNFARRAYAAMLRQPSSAAGTAGQVTRDLDQIRQFLSGAGPTAMIDLPWIGFFIVVLCLFHPLLALTVLIGGLILAALPILADRASRKMALSTLEAGRLRQSAIDECERNAETIRALGMGGRLAERWHAISGHHVGVYLRMAETTGLLSTISRIFRMLLQSIVLAVGAALVISDRATGGIIFASSILSSRALAPVEVAIVNWRGYAAARQAWSRLNSVFADMPREPVRTLLPAPRQKLACEMLTLLPPGGTDPVVRDASFAVSAGQVIGVIGPSASGKSSLIRGLAGLWPPARGQVRLDGAALDQWDADAIGRHMGYLSQSVQLLAGSITQNIARFDPMASDQAVIAAARSAGVHDLIVGLPQGYDTLVGRDGGTLSAGQQQRIALARALFGDPFLILLDEPNSNLDLEGEHALAEAVAAARARGAIVFVVAHRAAILDRADMLLVMDSGRIAAFGPRDAVFAQMKGQRRVSAVGPDAARRG